MRGVVNFGTAGRMRWKYGLRNDIGGKTGTTNNQADAWFIGYTPQILAGVWVGCDDREFRFKSERLGQGNAAALPIWALFMRRVYADKTLNINPNATFKQPDGFDDCGNDDEVITEGSEATEELEKPNAIPEDPNGANDSDPF